MLRKTVEPQHELIIPPGVAVDIAVLDEAERNGDAGIVVYRVATGQLLWAPLSRWRRGFKVNRRFGLQRGLRWCDLEPLPQTSRQLELFP